MNEPIGRVAYEAFRQKLASDAVYNGPEGIVRDEWEAIPAEEREAWQAAAEAAVTAELQNANRVWAESAAEEQKREGEPTDG